MRNDIEERRLRARYLRAVMRFEGATSGQGGPFPPVWLAATEVARCARDLRDYYQGVNLHYFELANASVPQD